MAYVLWITGLPGSGKSTVAERVKKSLPHAIVLRMDAFRKIVTPDPSYSDQERDLLYRSLVYLARVLYENGHSVIIDATANLRKWRDLAREIIPDFVEVYLQCSIEECRRREMERKNTHGAPKDIYKRAEEGWPVPGVNVPYEEPLHPEVTINTEKTSVEEAGNIIVAALKKSRQM
jgi:adenylylsulfate kinase